MSTPPLHKLDANESPLGPSPRVVDAIRKAAASLNRYPPRSDDIVRAALAQHHGRGLVPDHFFTALGGSDALELIARSLLGPGDEIIICSPTFRAYRAFATRMDARVVDVPLDPATFCHRMSAIAEAVTTRTRLVVVCNPNNPSGVMMTASDLAQLLDRLPDHVETLLDEAYVDFVSRTDFPDSIGLVVQSRPVIVVRTFSKVYGLAGLRLGYGIARPERCAEIAANRRAYHLSQLHVDAAVAALGDQAHVRQIVDTARAGRAYLFRELTRLRVKHWPSEANFVMIEPPLPPETLQERLHQHGVIVRSTESTGLVGCFRVTVGLPDANRAFITALEEAIH